MYRTVALARAVDERMWILNRAGRIPFVISGQGHEGAQVGLAWPLRRGHDWIAPFYRSIATCLTFGMTPRDLMLAQYAKASDPGSGGRQMPGHYGSPRTTWSSCRRRSPPRSCTRWASRWRRRSGAGPGRGRDHGRGELQPGRRPRGAQLRGHPQAAVRVHRREQRLRDQRAGGEGDLRQGRRDAGVAATASRASSWTAPTSSPATRPAREAVERARRGGGPTLIEAKVTRLTAHSSDDQQTKYRSEDDLAEGRAHDPLPIFRTQLREAGVLTTAIEAALGRRDRGARRGRDRLRRGRARSRSVHGHRLGLRGAAGRARRRRRGTPTPGASGGGHG